MTQPYAIRIENLSKRYRIGLRPRYRMLREAVRDRAASAWQALAGRTDQARDTLWALDDVSLQVPVGQSLGVIGSNGAGKTTLLKIISRITAPTRGRVRIRGRVGSLLEVGTGFHPELTGRENVYLNGAILGMRRSEIDRKFDEIVAFSETGQFLDTPVKFFSTGMQMRLAFAVAVHLEPAIMLVDEILAVGDQAFQGKSLAKMGEVIRDGRTILFVSHNMAAVRALCQKAVYLEKGRLKYTGSVEETIDYYLRRGPDQSAAQFHAGPDAKQLAQFLDVFETDAAGQLTSKLPHDRPFNIQIRLAVRAPLLKAHLGLSIEDSELDTILSSYDFEVKQRSVFRLEAGIYTYRVQVPAPLLVPGRYRLTLGVYLSTATTSRTLTRIEHICPFEVFDNGSQLSTSFIKWTGRVAPPLQWELSEVLNLDAGA